MRLRHSEADVFGLSPSPFWCFLKPNVAVEGDFYMGIFAVFFCLRRFCFVLVLLFSGSLGWVSENGKWRSRLG